MIVGDGGLQPSGMRWGKAVVDAGFTVLPNHLIAMNRFLPPEMRISPTAFVVLAQILVNWWSREEHPFPSKASIAERAGLSERQVQRALTELEKKEMLKRRPRFTAAGGRSSNEYDLRPLADRVEGFVAQHPSAFRRGGPAKNKAPAF